MKATYVFAKTLALVALIVSAGATVATWNAAHVSAFNPQPDPPAFGAIGITHEQTALISARLMVENPTTSSLDADGRHRARPVRVELMFHDSDGNVLARTEQTVEPEHSVSFALNGGELPIRADGMRVEVQPCIKVLNNPNDSGQARLVGSLEVFDNFGPDAGKTRFGEFIWF